VYARFGVPVLQVGDAPNFGVAREDLLDAGDVIGHADRGAALARDLDVRLARLHQAAPRTRPLVLYLSAGGAVAGSGTMMQSVIEAAGGRNVHQGESWTVMPLERLVEVPPALIALGFFDHGRSLVNPWLPGRHPAVRRALARAETVELPLPAISCEAWYAIDAAETLAAALRA
jgi:iron complex transport system substrate-binding protein